MKKIYSLFALITIFLSTQTGFSQGNTCATAEPFCTSVGTPYSYNNVTGSPSATSMGCLSTTPNQSWFYIKTSGAGAMTYSLTQSSVAPGGTPDLDVDFIAYGPYTAAQFSVACSTLLTGSCTGDHNCTGNIEDCSYSSAATETMTLTSPGAGQYFLIMITNYEGTAGYITFTQTGGSASDCSITCPPATFTLVATQDSNNANIPNGSTVNCSEPFWLDPPDLTPTGQPYNPFSDQLTPCLKVAINPITSQLQADGSLSVYENGTAYWTACPTVACPDNVGGSSTPGSQFNWFLGQVDPNFTHPAVFCRTTSAGTTPTVSLMSCWNNTLTLAGPQTWGTTTCFTLTAPTGTTAYGAANFSIAPATGSVGIVDLDWGKAYVDPSYLPSGTTYTVTYTFNNGVCGNVYGYYVFTVPSTPTITAISSQTVCSGATVAATNFTVTPSAGASVSWVNSNTGIGVAASGTTNIGSYTAPTVTASTVGTFTVASVSNGCIGNPRTFTITINPKPTANASGTNTLTCSNTTVSLSGSGGGTYSWTGPGIVSGSNSATPVVNAPGTYSLIVTNSLSCSSNVSTVSISQNTTAPTAGASNSTTLTCTTTTAALTGTGGGTYSWSGTGIVSGGTTANPVVNGTGPYTVIVTAANGCTATASTSVPQNTTAPTAGASNSTTLTCTTTTAALTGTGGGTYLWTGPGTITNSTTANPIVNTAGTYTVRVTAANGCTATANTTVSQNTTAPTAGASNSTTLTCSTTTVSLTGTGGGTYLWTGPGTITNSTTANPIVNTAGTFTVRVTAANGCTATANTTVSQNTTAPTAGASNSTTLTCSTTTAALTGTGGGTYLWTGPGTITNSTTANPIVNTAGTYTVRVTAANGCTATANTTVSQNTTAPSPSASNSSSLTCGSNTVALTGGPASGVTYQWSGPGFSGGTTSQNAVATAPGTYTLTVTNSVNSCTAAATTAVTQNTTAPSPSASNSSTLTCSTNTVSLTGGPASGVTYQWSGPGFIGGTTSQNAVATTPGTYTLTITSTVNSCTAAVTTTVTQNTTAPIVTMPSTQTITCASPSVSLIGSANPSTCTPVWTGGVCAGATSYTASACSPNTYTLTITNPLNGCTASGTVNAVASVGVPSVTASNSGSITCTNTTAQITASTTMTPVSYAWTGPGSITGASSSTGTVSVGGSYQCIVTNTLTGCASTITTIVPTNTTPVSASIAPTSSITCTTTSLTLSASPTGAFSYSWAPAAGLTGNSVATPTVNQGGTYSVTITNTVNGCFANANVTVPANTVAPTANIAVNSITTTCSAPTATLNVTATPTTGATYSWTAPGSGSLNTYTVSNPVASGSGVFTVVVTNTINGCSNAASQATVQIIPDAAIPTVSVSASNLTITCTNTTVTTSLTSTNTITSYNWSPAPVTGGANPVFNTPGLYNATVTASNGCAANVSINVALDNTVPTVTLSSTTNNGTLTCLTTSISITPTVSPNSNVTYTWSPSSGISTSTNQSSATFTAAGIYTLAVTNTVNGCVTSSTNTANTFTVIADNTPPTFTLGTAPSVTTTCASPNATLSASSNADPTAVYTWTTPTSSTLTGNPINTAAAGIYTVAVTNTVNGCSSAAVSTNTVEVVVDAGIPNITLSANSLSITCSNPTPSVAVSTTATPVTYSWSPTSGIVPGTETTANPSFNAAGSYSVVVTNTNSGCATDITTNVVNVTLDNTIPVISLSSSVNDGTITCTNTSVVVNPTVTPSSNLTYTWSPSAGISTPINQSSATFTANGVYTLAVTNTLTGCVSTSTSSANTFTVYLNNTTPTITATQTSTNSVIGCANPIVSYSTNVTSTGSSLTYTWNPGGANTPTIDINTAGVYDVTVMDAVSGCTASTQFTVSGNTTIPSADAGTNANIACGSSSVALNGTSTATNVSYAWAGPNASSIISGSNTANPTVADTGSYVLTVTDNATGCQNTATVVVTQANVAASFTANPTTGISPLTVNFTDQSTGANTWNWNFGDSNSSNAQNPTNTFNSGSYTVTLTASTGSCVSTATLLIIVEDGLTLEIPNVFTPNGDNVNDIFTVKSSGVKEITLQIFNRWGEKLYEFAGSKASWDGKTPNGGHAPEGTYFFFVKATGYDDKSIEQHGTLNLFR